MIHEKSLKLTFPVLHYCHACLVTTRRHKCPSPAEHMGPENGPETTKTIWDTLIRNCNQGR